MYGRWISVIVPKVFKCCVRCSARFLTYTMRHKKIIFFRGLPKNAKGFAAHDCFVYKMQACSCGEQITKYQCIELRWIFEEGKHVMNKTEMIKVKKKIQTQKRMLIYIIEKDTDYKWLLIHRGVCFLSIAYSYYEEYKQSIRSLIICS